LERLARESIVPTQDEAMASAAEFIRQFNAEQERLRNG